MQTKFTVFNLNLNLNFCKIFYFIKISLSNDKNGRLWIAEQKKSNLSIDIFFYSLYFFGIVSSKKKEAEESGWEGKKKKGRTKNLIDCRGVGGKPRLCVCVPGKACLLRETKRMRGGRAVSNLISPESKYLHGRKRRFTVVDIFPTFFFS